MERDMEEQGDKGYGEKEEAMRTSQSVASLSMSQTMPRLVSSQQQTLQPGHGSQGEGPIQ